MLLLMLLLLLLEQQRRIVRSRGSAMECSTDATDATSDTTTASDQESARHVDSIVDRVRRGHVAAGTILARSSEALQIEPVCAHGTRRRISQRNVNHLAAALLLLRHDGGGAVSCCEFPCFYDTRLSRSVRVNVHVSAETSRGSHVLIVHCSRMRFVFLLVHRP